MKPELHFFVRKLLLFMTSREGYVPIEWQWRCIVNAACICDDCRDNQFVPPSYVSLWMRIKSPLYASWRRERVTSKRERKKIAKGISCSARKVAIVFSVYAYLTHNRRHDANFQVFLMTYGDCVGTYHIKLFRRNVNKTHIFTTYVQCVNRRCETNV